MKWEFWPWRLYLSILPPLWILLSMWIPLPMWIPRPGDFLQPKDQLRITWTFMGQICTCCSRPAGWGGCTEGSTEGPSSVGVRTLNLTWSRHLLKFVCSKLDWTIYSNLSSELGQPNSVAFQFMLWLQKIWLCCLGNDNHMAFFSFLDRFFSSYCIYRYKLRLIVHLCSCKMGRCSVFTNPTLL